MIKSIKVYEAQKHKKYNSLPVSILISSLEVPEFLVRQFKQEIISGFWSFTITKIIEAEEDGSNLF